MHSWPSLSEQSICGIAMLQDDAQPNRCASAQTSATHPPRVSPWLHAPWTTPWKTEASSAFQKMRTNMNTLLLSLRRHTQGTHCPTAWLSAFRFGAVMHTNGLLRRSLDFPNGHHWLRFESGCGESRGCICPGGPCVALTLARLHRAKLGNQNQHSNLLHALSNSATRNLHNCMFLTTSL